MPSWSPNSTLFGIDQCVADKVERAVAEGRLAADRSVRLYFKLVNLSVDRSVNRSGVLSFRLSVDPSVDQSVGRSTHRSIGRDIDRSVEPSVGRSDTHRSAGRSGLSRSNRRSFGHAGGRSVVRSRPVKRSVVWVAVARASGFSSIARRH